MPDLQPQFRTGAWTFLLDGRVVEWFHQGSSDSRRVHVDHVRMDGEQDGRDLEVTWGIGASGAVVNGGRVTISGARVGDFQDYVGMAIANRTPA